ncbi:MAG: hypothetical protein ACREH6_03640 [Geminicoccaceae bacterium]
MTNGYIDDPDGAQAAKAAGDPKVGVIITIGNDGSMELYSKTGKVPESITLADQPRTVPGQHRGEIVIYTRNPTCVRCLHQGQWKQLCW